MLACASTPPPRVRGAHIHPAELRTGDAGHAVKSRQAFIQKGVIGVQEIEHAAVMADDVLDEQLGFAAHGMPQAFIEFGKALAIRPHHVDVAELQPLARRNSRPARALSHPRSMRRTCASRTAG